MTGNRYTLYAALAFSVVLYSCSAYKRSATANYDNRLSEKYWKLTAIMGSPAVFSGTREAYLIFKAADHHFTGHSSCNPLTGTYQLKNGHRIRCSGVTTTEMVCADMTTEKELLNLLQTTIHYQVRQDTLLLHNGKKELLARFEAVYLR